MHRRLLLTALGCWPAARLGAQESPAGPRHKIGAAQLHAALTARFPVRLGLPGVLELQVSAPRLHLLPTRNKLGAGLVAELTRTRGIEAGEVDVVFALRYEAADRTLRAHGMEVLDLRWPGLPAETAQLLRALLPRLAKDAVGDFVLHRFSDRELALADTMGFEPAQFTVADDGLVIAFGRKPPR
ncbi:MAG TPA: DUF1439 domain-containing protein [Ramlibacter sp.]|jgi:hypothetical protein